MSEQNRPFVWQMIRQALDALGTPTTNVAVRDWVLERYPGTNKSTVQCQIIACTVNHHSRVHYPGNQKPRTCNTQHDFLYRPTQGTLERFDPKRHGEWEIGERDDGTLLVRLADQTEDTLNADGDAGQAATASGGSAFAAEAHLRDYLVQHLEDLEAGLDLFVDENGVDGIEFSTPIGRIDILATDQSGSFVVIELKVGKGPDAVCGQLMRYMGWIKRHLAQGKPVRGLIVAQRIPDRIRYAMADLPHVQLKEYELSLTLRDSEPLD